MIKLLYSTGLALVSAGLLFGCASTPYTPEPFEPAPLDSTAFVPKADTFVILLDASSSMDSEYKDREKFYYAKDIVARMNRTLPPLDYQAGLVVFGSGSCLDGDKVRLVYGLAPYEQAGLASGVNVIECAGGVTPMADAVDTSNQLLKGHSGRVALIIVSDFWDIDSQDVVDAVDALKMDHRDSLCIHSIQIGDKPSGHTLMKELASVGGCGSYVNADNVASPDAMADYVTTVLLTPAPEPVVQYEKTTLSSTALFDFDKAVLKDEGKAAIHKLDGSIRRGGASVVDIDVIGHTDNIGSAEYNQQLSVRRATAVKDYMVSEGIDSNIIDVSGRGADDPAYSNATSEGRAQNRRVEIHVGVKQPAN